MADGARLSGAGRVGLVASRTPRQTLGTDQRQLSQAALKFGVVGLDDDGGRLGGDAASVDAVLDGDKALHAPVGVPAVAHEPRLQPRANQWHGPEQAG